MVKLGEWFYITYACRHFPFGQFWIPKEKQLYKRPECPPDFPRYLRINATLTGLLLTKDFKTWIRAGWLTDLPRGGQGQILSAGRAALLDLEDPGKVLHRTPDGIMQAEAWYEVEGYYRGVCFPCGAAVIDGTLFVYYGGADKYVCVATCALDELIEYLLSCPA